MVLNNDLVCLHNLPAIGRRRRLILQYALVALVVLPPVAVKGRRDPAVMVMVLDGPKLESGPARPLEP